MVSPIHIGSRSARGWSVTRSTSWVSRSNTYSSCAQPPSYRFQVRKSRNSGEYTTRVPSGERSPAPDSGIGSGTGSPPSVETRKSRLSDRSVL